MTRRSMETELKHQICITSESGDCPGAIHYFLLHYLLSREDVQSFVSRVTLKGVRPQVFFPLMVMTCEMMIMMSNSGIGPTVTTALVKVIKGQY